MRHVPLWQQSFAGTKVWSPWSSNKNINVQVISEQSLLVTIFKYDWLLHSVQQLEYEVWFASSTTHLLFKLTQTRDLHNQLRLYGTTPSRWSKINTLKFNTAKGLHLTRFRVAHFLICRTESSIFKYVHYKWGTTSKFAASMEKVALTVDEVPKRKCRPGMPMVKHRGG